MIDTRAALQQAQALHQQNKLGEAERLYRAILQQEPLNAAALHNLGLIGWASGHVKPALELISQSLRLDPQNVTYRMSHIGVLEAAGHRGPAEEAARNLVTDRPDDLKIRGEYAQLLLSHGKPDLASQEWGEIARRSPNDFGSVFRQAFALESAGRFDLAEQRYREALRIKPDFAEAMANLGGIVLRGERHEAALPLLQEAVRRLPGNATVMATLSSALTLNGRVSEGMAMAKKAAELAPNDTDVLRNLAFAHLQRGEVDPTIRVYERICELAPKNLEVMSTLLMTRLYIDAPGEQDLKNHRRYSDRAATIITPRPPPMRTLAPGERLRIGYVSPDFRNHPVGRFIEPLLTHHDRERFEVHCFSNSAVNDDITKRIRAHVDAFHEVLTLNFEQLDALIREKKIDILIDLAGHTGSTCLSVFAAKPAPVQITYLGYPNTTGLATIDFRITDAVADPPGHSDTIHSERLLRLPMSFGLFHMPAGAPEIVPSPHLANGFITFGSISRLEKWTPPMLASWAAVLAATPGARFRIIGLGFEDQEFKEQVIQRLRDAGIDPIRVDLVGRQPFNGYLAEISKIDLLLDTYPFNGHTTTLQALHMGVPTVTLAGNVHRARMGASVMHAMGLDDLVATSHEQFERTAIELAKNPSRLVELRQSLRQSLLQSSLSDAPAFARAFEALLLEAWNHRRTT